MNECKCSMSISVLGDGCRHCQPQTYIDHLETWLGEERARNAELEAALRESREERPAFKRSDGKSQTDHELEAMQRYIEKITKDKHSAVGFLTRAGIIDGSGELAEHYRSIESKGLT